MKLDFDCIIIGAGVSGMTSAIYLKRSGISVAIIEKNYIGGQMTKTYTIKNYPGFSEIDGVTLANNIGNQLKELDIPIIFEGVTEIISENDYKIVRTKKSEYKTKSVVIATGRKERHLNLLEENKFISRGISYCATCDGNLFKGYDVAVVGGGNTAMEDVLYLSRICNKVYLINRSLSFRADEILLSQVKTQKNVEIITDCVPVSIVSEENKFQGITLNNGKQLNISGLFVAIGSEPNIDFVDSLNLIMDNNYIIVNSKMETNIPGIYACGDIIKKDLYQIVTAASDGAIAANSVKNYIE